MRESANSCKHPWTAHSGPTEARGRSPVSRPLLVVSLCQFSRNMAGPSHLRMPRAGAQKVGDQASLTGVFFHSRNVDGAASVLGDTVINKTQVPV